MIAVYINCWTADSDLEDMYGEPIFYVRSERDLQRMFAMNPAWRVKETRIRAIAGLELCDDKQGIIDTDWRVIGQAVAVYR